MKFLRFLMSGSTLLAAGIIIGWTLTTTGLSDVLIVAVVFVLTGVGAVDLWRADRRLKRDIKDWEERMEKARNDRLSE